MHIIDDVEAQQQYWENLVTRIASGEPGGPDEFRATYRPGIRFLLQRRFGGDRVDEVVDDAVDGIVKEISARRLTTVAEMARYIRKLVPRERTVPAGPVITQRDRQSSPVRTQTLDQALQQFNSMEREALISYYARGFSERDVEAEFGYDAVAFRYLRERLVRAFNGVRARRGANGRRAGFFRSSAAAAGGAA